MLLSNYKGSYELDVFFYAMDINCDIRKAQQLKAELNILIGTERINTSAPSMLES